MPGNASRIALAACAALVLASGPALAGGGRGTARTSGLEAGQAVPTVDLTTEQVGASRDGLLENVPLVPPESPLDASGIHEGLGPPERLLQGARLAREQAREATPAQTETVAVEEKKGEEEEKDPDGLFTRVLSGDSLSPQDVHDAVGQYPATVELRGLHGGERDAAGRIYEKAKAGVEHDASAQERGLAPAGEVPQPRDWALSGHYGEKRLTKLLRRAARPTLHAMNREEERGASGVLGWLRPWRWATFAEAMANPERADAIVLRALARAGLGSSQLEYWVRETAFERGRLLEIGQALASVNKAIIQVKASAPPGSALALLNLPRIPTDEGVVEFLPVEILDEAANATNGDARTRARAREDMAHVGAFHRGGKIFILAALLRAADARQAAAIILHEWLAMHTGLPHYDPRHIAESAGNNGEHIDVAWLVKRITTVAFGRPVRDSDLQYLLNNLKPTPPGRGVWGERLRDPEWYARAIGSTLALGIMAFAALSLATGLWPVAGGIALILSWPIASYLGYEVASKAMSYQSNDALFNVLVSLLGMLVALVAIFGGFVLAIYAVMRIVTGLAPH